MTFRQWLTHLRQWLFSFPLKRHDDHTWVGLARGNHYTCLVCEAEWDDPEKWIDTEDEEKEKEDATDATC